MYLSYAYYSSIAYEIFKGMYIIHSIHTSVPYSIIYKYLLYGVFTLVYSKHNSYSCMEAKNMAFRCPYIFRLIYIRNFSRSVEKLKLVEVRSERC